jgi:hypothetical protein
MRLNRERSGEQNRWLIDGRDRGYLDDNRYFRLTNLASAARTATKNLTLSKRGQADHSDERESR